MADITITELEELTPTALHLVKAGANGFRPLAAKAEADAKCATCDGTGKILAGNRKCPDCAGTASPVAVENCRRHLAQVASSHLTSEQALDLKARDDRFVVRQIA